MFGITTSALG